ncbi:MAG: hypothetical protein GTO41_27565, partial [Burkholderiales bacterium]|nr:hypothetical protein [Burkholderiales bacterium]
AAGLRYLPIKPFVEQQPVGQIGDLIVVGEILDTLLRPLSFRYVFDRNQNTRPVVLVRVRYENVLANVYFLVT